MTTVINVKNILGKKFIGTRDEARKLEREFEECSYTHEVVLNLEDVIVGPSFFFETLVMFKKLVEKHDNIKHRLVYMPTYRLSSLRHSIEEHGLKLESESEDKWVITNE